MKLKDNVVTEKTEVEIERVPSAELSERENGQPNYKEQVVLSEEQIDRLKEEIFKAYDRLVQERKPFDDKWDTCEAQYKGEMEDAAGLEFNLNVPVTQVKVDSLTRLALKSFLESDPKFSITPRPVMAKVDKWDIIVNRQSDYLDYKLDEEIDIENPLRKVIHQATLFDVGILKISYEYLRKKRRREEHFSGKMELGQDGQTIQRPGLEAFLREYPSAIQPDDSGHWAYKQLLDGKDVMFKVSFMDLVYDDPKPKFVDCRDFYVDINTEGYQGLCDAQLKIEKLNNSWWELKKAEKNGDFINVDECRNPVNDEGVKSYDKDYDDYKSRNYEILACDYHFNMVKDSEDIDDEEHIICWFDISSKTFLGAIYYPYDNIECDYVPFYIKNKTSGFYKGGLAEDLTDSHLAQNAMLNFMLTEAWQQLMTTPIYRQGSPIASQFSNKRWKPGVPLEIPSTSLDLDSELRFLDKPQRAVAQQLMPILLFLSRYDDDKTGISSLATGKESPVDPTAPASKTAMLLQQSGINISDYINCLLPSFNLIGTLILQLTYQMSREGKSYRQKKIGAAVAGGDPFEAITRDQMSYKTNIQSRAAGFAFDKINEKRENIALFQLLRVDPILSQNPNGIYNLARTLVQSWSPLWKNKIDSILPDPQTFQQGQVKLAMQALGQYLTVVSEQRKLGGTKEPKFEEFIQMASQMAQEALTPQNEG